MLPCRKPRRHHIFWIWVIHQAIKLTRNETQLCLKPIADLSYNHTERQVEHQAACQVARSYWNALWLSKMGPRSIPKCHGKCQNFKAAAWRSVWLCPYIIGREASVANWYKLVLKPCYLWEATNQTDGVMTFLLNCPVVITIISHFQRWQQQQQQQQQQQNTTTTTTTKKTHKKLLLVRLQLSCWYLFAAIAVVNVVFKIVLLLLLLWMLLIFR